MRDVCSASGCWRLRHPRRSCRSSANDVATGCVGCQGCRQHLTGPDIWGWSGWAAIAAIAQVFAAVGTVGALLFLWLQFTKLQAQLQLERRAHQETQRLARPLLQAAVSRVNPLSFNVVISWIRGTQPAPDVEVWVKQRAGVYVVPCGTVPAQTRVPDADLGGALVVDERSAVTSDLWPFPETADDDPLAPEDFWAGLKWRSEDQYRGRELIRCRTDEDPTASPPIRQRYFVLVPSHMMGTTPEPHEE